jgi:DNA-binding response OmpR family regulator
MIDLDRAGWVTVRNEKQGVPTVSVLLVEDNQVEAKRLSLALAPFGYRVNVARTGQEAQAAARQLRPSAVILDLRLPDISGLEVCQRLRESSLVPIVVVTATDDHEAHLESLRRGADDVLIKPVDPEELRLRLDAILRRVQGGAPTIPPDYHYRGLRIDFARHRTTLHGRELLLTPIDQRLLEALARQPGMVRSADDLLVDVWGPHAETQYATLYLQISRLRQKLGEKKGEPVYIFTRSRIGYMVPASEPPPPPNDHSATLPG